MSNSKDLKVEKLKLLEQKRNHELSLPYKYGWKNYKWMTEFLESNNRTVLLTAANQIGKSSVQIRKMIMLACEKELWPKYFRKTPKLFWYLYPTANMATIEFRSKWVTDFLPRGEYKKHPVYGWKEEYRNRGDIFAIHFNSGVSIYFKTYAQDESHLQASSVDYVACFTGESLVDTEHGKKRIDEIKVGDKVWTKEGRLRRVYGLKSRKAKVIKRTFSDGSFIEATPEHLFWVNEGYWKRFDQLTSGDILHSNSAWESLEGLSTQSLTVKSIEDTPNQQTEGTGIFVGLNTSKALEEKIQREHFATYIQKFGNFTKVRYLRGLLFTTLMEMYQTIQSIIYLLSLEPNTTSITKKKSGLLADLVFTEQGYVSSANSNFKLDQLKKQPEDFAARSAENIREVDVYCLQVEEDHNFFVNGVCVKNCDEELPEHLWEEINFRRNATDGLFSMVFTATLAQEFWRKCMEPHANENVVMPEAWKRQVTLFDCMYFEDKTPSHWTTEKINRTIAMCRSEAEVLKRVYGRFVQDSGLKYSAFNRSVNVITPFAEIPPNWLHFCGIDLGAGGSENHPSTITFIAIRPDYKYGVVYRHWRGDKEATTMSDVANQFIKMAEYTQFSGCFYDYHSKEFKLVTDRMGMTFMPADKGHDVGEQIINTLFKNKMLSIYSIPEMEPLIGEIMSLLISTDKRQAKDDSIDSMRYGVTRIPWDWSHVGVKIDQADLTPRIKRTPNEQVDMERERGRQKALANGNKNDFNESIEKELDEWASYYDLP